MAEIMIRASGLAFGYRIGDFQLKVRDLGVGSGEKVGIIGPSGCGKTTLLHLLAGILVPAKGEISVCGERVSALSSEDRQDYRALKMGLVFQEFELLDYLDLLDNVLLPYRISPVLALDAGARERAALLLRQVGLSDKRRRYPRLLSQGERQRVAVCRALVSKPAVLLGDEPTGNLDPENRDNVMDSLCRYADDTGASLVMVTHDRELHDRFDRIVDVREFQP